MRRTYDIKPTVNELAIEFCMLDEKRRVDFLVMVAREVESYGNTDAAAWMLNMGLEIREAGGLAQKLVNAWASPCACPAPERP